MKGGSGPVPGKGVESPEDFPAGRGKKNAGPSKREDAGLIESYSFGRIVIRGREYRSDVMIIEGKVFPEWRRGQGHLLKKGDLGPVLEAGIHTLIIGRGYNGVMQVGEDVREYCRAKGIELIEMKSADAVEECNRRMGEGVAAGIHLTC